ncbi:MAG: hypothetical protein AAF561_17085, partial [Planctomycetota bacterium]
MATIDTSTELERLGRRGLFEERDPRDDTVTLPPEPKPQTFRERNVEIDNTGDVPGERAPLVLNHKTFRDVTDT